MRLYTCGQQTKYGALRHPCGVAGDALTEAGHAYEVETVGGYKLMPWTRRGERDEVRELTGQEDVPVLVLDDGNAIAGTGRIVSWAKANPAGT